MRCSLPVAVFDRITTSLKFPTILISTYARFPINDSTSTIHKSFNGSVLIHQEIFDHTRFDN